MARKGDQACATRSGEHRTRPIPLSLLVGAVVLAVVTVISQSALFANDKEAHRLIVVQDLQALSAVSPLSLSAAKLEALISAGRPVLIRFDPHPNCPLCAANSPFWEGTVAKRWPRETFVLHCWEHPQVCIDRGVGSEGRSTIGSSLKGPVFARPVATPSIQAWAGRRGGWVRYRGPLDPHALYAFCERAINPAHARKAESSRRLGQSAAVVREDQSERAPGQVEGGRFKAVKSTHSIDPITSSAEFALLRIDPHGCALPADPSGDRSCEGLDSLWELTAQQVKPRGGIWHLSCDDTPETCESQVGVS